MSHLQQESSVTAVWSHEEKYFQKTRDREEVMITGTEEVKEL